MNIDTTTILIAITIILALFGTVISIRAYRKDRASLGNIVGAISLIVAVIGIFISRNTHSDAKGPTQLDATSFPPTQTHETEARNEQATSPNRQEKPSGVQAAVQLESVKNTNTDAVFPNSGNQAQTESMPEPADLTAEEAYREGKNAAQKNNPQKAAKYYQSAADRGFAAAAYELALLCQTGKGVAKNESMAFRYMKMAADAGFVNAFRPLGEMYHGGRGVDKDRNMAVDWYQKAVDSGDEAAKRILYNM